MAAASFFSNDVWQFPHRFVTFALQPLLRKESWLFNDRIDAGAKEAPLGPGLLGQFEVPAWLN
jgi:hypothetical protein